MMKKTILKIVWFILLFLIWFNNSYSYTSDELITLYTDSPSVWTSLYIVPEWKDLILNRINSSDSLEEISLRDWSTGSARVVISKQQEYTWGELVIKDEVQIIASPWSNVDIIIFWYLVSEDESIENYIEWNSSAWNKHIFDKEDIDFIYFREFIFFIFIMVIKFFEFIIWRKLIMK